MVQSTTLDVAQVGFLYGHGGDAIQMLELARGLSERGASVKVVVPRVPESESFAERAARFGVSCDRSPLLKVGTDGVKQHPLQLLRLLRSIDAPLIHFHTGNSSLPRVLMPLLATMPRRTFVVTIQSPYEVLRPGSSRARYWAATANRVLDLVISPSNHGSEYQVRLGVRPSKTATVRNSIDAEAMQSGDGARCRDLLGIGEDESVVLFCSRIDRQKRPLDAVEIFRRVATDFPDAHLVVVGVGELRDAMQEALERAGLGDRSHLVGYRTDVPDWLAASTVWLLPTERENFSLAVLEAMAAGCAVVSTASPGNDEVLVDGENSRTFAVGDVEGGAAAVRALLGDRTERERLGAAAREQARDYTGDKMVEAYCDAYARLGHAAVETRG